MGWREIKKNYFIQEFDLEQHLGLGIGIQKAIRNGSTAESSTGTFNYRTNKATGSSGMGKTNGTGILMLMSLEWGRTRIN
jgi:hypothetical protein